MAKSGKKDFNPNPQQTFMEFLWNTEEGTCLGRTGGSWFKITVFYIIYFIWLAGFFWLCYYIFSLTLEPNAPKWKLSESLIGTNPGLGFRPMPDQDVNPSSTLIWYKQGVTSDRRFWSSQVEKFVEKTNSQDTASLFTCDYGGPHTATKDKGCRVDMSPTTIGYACTVYNEYGYSRGEPCIILKLNKVYGWAPEGYGLTDRGEYDARLLEEELNEEQEKDGMPEWLMNYIKTNVVTAKNASSFLNTVWISCDGENPADVENVGDLEYIPQPGIPGYFFPYYNQIGYQTPFIFLKVKHPYPGVLINIECKAWAKNIHPDRLVRVGSVHFELLID